MELRRRLFNHPRGQHVLKRTEVIALEGNTSVTLARNFWTLLGKSLGKPGRIDKFQLENILKIIEYVSYSIRYCKI